MVRVEVVPTTHVSTLWGAVRQFLEAAIDMGEGPADYNIHHVQAYVTSGQWLLLVAVGEHNEVKGAATVSFINYPLNRIAFVTAIGGRGIVSREAFTQMRSILKQYGATKLQGFARPSIQRLYQGRGVGFTAVTTLLEMGI